MFNIEKVTQNSVRYLGIDMVLTQLYLLNGYQIMVPDKYITIEMDEGAYCFDITIWSIDNVYYSTTSEFINALYA